VVCATYNIEVYPGAFPGSGGQPAIVQISKHMQYKHMEEAQGCVLATV